MKRLSIILLFAFIVSAINAQRTCVIADMETHLPIKEVLIHTNTNHWARTNYTGQFSMTYAFDSATVSKPGYIATTVYLNELPDTVYLLPQAQQLKEVQVWGKDSKHITDMQKLVTRNLSDYVAKPAGASAAFDFGNILDARGRRDAHHSRDAHGIINDLENTGDPIVNAYEKTMQELGKESKIKKK
nr:hypothetical protein [Prevotella sp.]